MFPQVASFLIIPDYITMHPPVCLMSVFRLGPSVATDMGRSDGPSLASVGFSFLYTAGLCFEGS